MSKYNLSELLTEVAGGRIGTLEISARDLVRKMEDLEDKGVRVDRFDGLSPDGKTYIEFHVHPMRKYDEDTSFSIYDFKFGFDPMSPEHSDQEYPFSIGGRSAARDSAETVLRSGDMGFEIKEAEEIKEDKEKDLINALRFHVMMLEKGNIDKDDFVNAVEELAFGQRRGPMQEEDVDEVMGIDRKGRKKPESKSNMTKVNEYDQADAVADYIKDFYKNPKTGESMISDEMVDEFYKTHPEWEDQADGTKEGMKAVLDNFNEFFEINYGIMFDDSRDIDENLKNHFKRFM